MIKTQQMDRPFKSQFSKYSQQEKLECFGKELENLINKYNLENKSNTPDFILADYLITCLKNFEKTSKRREKWYGKSLHI
jgi:hypothetical protein